MNQNVWYPLCRPDDEKIIIQNAEGIYLYDNRGKEYIDANSGLWNVSLGYGNSSVDNRINNQLQKVSYVNSCEFGTKISLELANTLKVLHHDEIDKIAFTCTGSESVELAIKLIRKYASMGKTPEKNGIVVLKNSYHGSYYGAMSLSGYDGCERVGYGPLLTEIYEISLPFAKYFEEYDESYFKDLLDNELNKYKDRIAGIIVEPVLGSAGVFPLPEWFLRRIIDFSKENEICTVFDEVATGFGRTGEMFFYQKYNLKPDIITMSKGINNGVLPLGAVAISKKIIERFREKNEIIFHLSTQNGNALSCAAAIGTLDVLLENDRSIVKSVKEKNTYFLNKIKSEIGIYIKEIRECGMMFALELTEKNGEQLAISKLLKIVELLKKNGLVMEWSYIEKMTSCLVIFLPLIVNEEQMDEIIEKLKKSLKRFFKKMDL